MTHPRSALRFPLEGAAPAAWQSQFRGTLESSPASDDATDTARHPYRAVFISDLHLGTPGCQAAALLDFLKAYPSDYLYLVGDIVDGWQLRRRWYWPQAHNDVVQKLLDAGAACLGKTNLDQFACGLNGTRSPYGEVPGGAGSRFIALSTSAGSKHDP